MLPTMALCFMRAMCVAMMMSLLPVAVTNTSVSSSTVSSRATRKPSMAACSAQMGSTSVTVTMLPAARSACAQPLPTSPKPHTTARLPASITSVARMMPSGSEWRQPYRLSNLDLVTESFTLMAGNSSVPAFSIWYSRCTPVVVSSDTPTSRSAMVRKRFGLSGISRRRMPSTIFISALSVDSGSGREPSASNLRSNLTPSWMSSVMSPPSSTIRSGPRPLPSSSGQVHARIVHSQYSSSVSPFHANTPTSPRAAMAEAAWSCVEKMLHEHQRTSAPSSHRVSIKTAVCTVMCSDPLTRAPASTLPNSSRHCMSPGISTSARVISLRPKSARVISATL
mmetsp:Transcript_13686/g.43741  ORF Transcript_13686/g.43741 Transcript_13686/m.43741 type:complete len:338 (+) Transcript_13686:743-1756(+)